MAFTASNSDKKFFSVSIFSSRCADRRIYFPFSIFTPVSELILLCISDASIAFRLFDSTSAIGLPVTKVLSGGSPHPARYLLACSEYAIFTSEMISTILRLVSSGRHSSLHLFPASIWKIGIWSLFAPITDRHEFVSPSTSTASGLIVAISLYDLSMMFPIVSPRSSPTASRYTSGSAKPKSLKKIPLRL